MVIARTEDAQADDALAGLGGLSLFLVETFQEDEDGHRHRLAQIQRIEEKLGHHASATVAVNFEHATLKILRGLQAAW